jgi:methylmalonyl-CoA mutase
MADGATGLSLVFAGATTAFGAGLPAAEGTIATVLDGVSPDGLALRLDAHPSSRLAAGWLVGHLAARKADPARLRLSLGIDPAAVFARNGRLNMSVEALKASMPQSLAHFFATGVPGILLEADGRVFHNAGATSAQEIGAALAIASGHLKLFEQARQALVYAAPHIGFALGVDDDAAAFAAKAEAVRRLWAQMLAGRSIEAGPLRIHAETSSRLRDARGTTLACRAAAWGRADTLAVARAEPGEGGRGAAITLALEATGDAAGPGSGAIEALVDSLCEAGRAEFLAIEREGGILDSLAAGHVQERVFAAAGRSASRAPSSADGAVCAPLEPIA